MQDIPARELHGFPAYARDLPFGSSESSRLRNLWMDGVRFSGEESARVASLLRSYFPDVDLRPMIFAGILTSDI